MGNGLSELDGSSDQMDATNNHGNSNLDHHRQQNQDADSSNHHSLPPPLPQPRGVVQKGKIGMQHVANSARTNASQFLKKMSTKVQSHRGMNSLDSEVQQWEDQWDDDSSVEGDGGVSTQHQVQPQQTHQEPLIELEDKDDAIIDELSKKANEALSSVHWEHYDDKQKPELAWFLPFLRVLGKGSFGKVVLVRQNNLVNGGRLYAMKILRKAHLLQKRQIERTKTERLVLEKACAHPFLMRMHYAFQTPTRLFLVLDYCPGGELFFHLSRFKRFPERVAKFYAAELLLALGHLHSLQIIYRDLKPENVLLDAEGHVKLGDFGLAKMGIEHPYRGANSMCGTPEYMAPEVLSQAGHGFCVDYWGLGMIVYEMMTGLPPWYTTDRSKLFKRLKHDPLVIPSFFTQDASACIAQLLERNPMYRLGVQGVRQCMLHSFFAPIKWQDLYHRRIIPPIRPCEGWIDSLNSVSASYDTQNKSNHTEYHLDRAVSNFEQHFTRMPLNTDDSSGGKQQQNGSGRRRGSDSSEEGNQTDGLFPGFTFDKELDDEAPPSPGRARHSAHPTNQQKSYNQYHSHSNPSSPIASTASIHHNSGPNGMHPNQTAFSASLAHNGQFNGQNNSVHS